MVAFVYIWIHYTGKWYIGYHRGTEDDGYITSSKIVKPMIKSNPTHWRRYVICYGTQDDMLNIETRLLTMLDARRNPMSYNQHNGNGKDFTFKAHTEESKQKLSQAHKGKPAHNKGKPRTEQERKNISEALKRHYAVYPQWNKGKKMKEHNEQV